MELSRKQIEKAGSVAGAGVGGAAVLACAACCMPLLAPLLAGLGLAGLALPGALALAAGALGVGALAWMAMARRRRPPCHGASQAETLCNAKCGTSTVSPDESTALQSAPIACTLSSADFKARSLWLHELQERALVRHREEGSSLHLEYRVEHAADVERMVQQEQACCAFLHFELQHTPSGLVVTVTAPPEAAADARTLFAHLVPA